MAAPRCPAGRAAPPDPPPPRRRPRTATTDDRRSTAGRCTPPACSPCSWSWPCWSPTRGPTTPRPTATPDARRAETVPVRRVDYIGEPVDEVEAAPGRQGPEDDHRRRRQLRRPRGRHRRRPRPRPARSAQGATITLDVWGEPPTDEGDQDDPEDRRRPRRPSRTSPTRPSPARPPATRPRQPDNTRHRRRRTTAGNDSGGREQPRPGNRQPNGPSPSKGPKGD